MKSLSLLYINEEQLIGFLKENSIDDNKTLLQIFCGVNDKKEINSLLKLLKKYLPKIKIIGATTSGEIIKGKNLNNSIVFNFTIFENTEIKTKILRKETSSFNLGKALINCFSKEDFNKSKVAISFADGISINAEEYLKGINVVNENLIISGGLAGDNYEFKKTYVFNENEILEDGAVIALLINEDLEVFTNYNFNWKSISKTYKIEKSHDNIVFKIDGKSAVDFYSHYVGTSNHSLLSRITLDFPLIIQDEGIEVARVALSSHDDGSLSFAGNVKEGSNVKIGYGNIQNILEKTIEDVYSLDNQNIESLFIYSCAARKELLGEAIFYELEPYEQAIGNTSGFFTYGEFYHTNKSNEVLNHTMTILGLSESKTKRVKVNKKDISLDKNFKNKSLDFYKTQGLSQIISITSKELEELNNNLQKKVDEQVLKERKQDALMETNFRQAQMGEMINMIVHQYRQPLNNLSMSVSSMELFKQKNLLNDELFEKLIKQLYESINHLDNTIEDFRDFFKNSNEKIFITPDELIEKTLTISNSLFTKFNIKLIKDLEFNRPLHTHVSKMLQVLLNIIKNAADEIERKNIKNPFIKIRVYKEEEFCVFEIEDNALGIAANNINDVFQKGFTTKAQKDGTGIGLDMSKNLVEKHLGGEISAKNLEKGALFTVKITIE